MVENKVLNGVRIAYGLHNVESTNTAFKNMLMSVLTSANTLATQLENVTRQGCAFAITQHKSNEATAIIDELLNETFPTKSKATDFIIRCGFKIGSVDGKKCLLEWVAPDGWTLDNAEAKISELQWEKDKAEKKTVKLDDTAESLAFLLNDRKDKILSGKRDWENKGAHIAELLSYIADNIWLIEKLKGHEQICNDAIADAEAKNAS